MVNYSLGRGRTRRVTGAVLATGVGLGGLAFVAPDVKAQAYGATCDLVLNTNAPPTGTGVGDPHWDSFVPVESSMGDPYDVPVFVSEAAAGGVAVSSPYAPTSSASNAAGGGSSPGRVICVVGSGPAIINGTAGDDTIYGSVGNETINGMGGNDLLIGNGGDDVLIGKSGNDSLDGGDGNDVLFGHVGRNQQNVAGDDTLKGGSGNDLIRGDAGNDVINGGSGDDCLLGGYGNDEVYGWDDDDTIAGGAGADVLAGNDNNDYIFGGKGNDTLRGNDGLDQIWGDSDLFDIGIEMTRTFVQNAAGGAALMSVVDSIPVSAASGVSGQLYTPGQIMNSPEAVTMASQIFASAVGESWLLNAPIAAFELDTATDPLPTDYSTVPGVIENSISAHPAISPVLVAAGPPGNYVQQSATALLASGPILGPVTVPTNKLDFLNSSMVGGIEVSFATPTGSKKFWQLEPRALVENGAWGADALREEPFTMRIGEPVTSSSMGLFVFADPVNATPAASLLAGALAAAGAILVHNYVTVGAGTASVPLSMAAAVAGANLWQTVVSNGTPLAPQPVADPLANGDIVVDAAQVITTIIVPHVASTFNVASGIHQRRGHLEVAACNLDAPRVMDDAFEISPTDPFVGFPDVSFTGLATLHMSSLMSSSRGDIEVPLLNDALAGGPGPSGAFLGWPDGYTGGNFNDDIRGGDSDDRLFGEIGQDTVRGDHGDDTIGGEGDGAAWALGDAVLNLGPAIGVFDLEVDGVPTFVYDRTRKVPIGVAEQYAGGAGDDSLMGNDDDDRIEGGGGADRLSGGPDDDSLDGDDGDDQVDGGADYDACANGFVANCEVIL